MIDLAANLTVCICTRDRPADLARSLASIAANAPAASVVVSDDGDGSAAAVAERFPRCRWQRGPANGLGANRNAVVRAATTPWVLFLDDDALLGEEFVGSVEACLREVEAAVRERTIVTGRERNRGVLVAPHDVDFLGFQRRPYGDGEELRTVVINAAVWPRRLFDSVAFDERLRYGSDEVDLSYAALAAGYRIRDCPRAVNEHRPSPRGRGDYELDAHASRLWAGVKRNWRVRRSPAGTLAYAVLAPLHLLGSLLRSEGLRGLGSYRKVLQRWLLDRR